MKKKFFLPLIGVLLLLCISCTKQPTVGPQGPQGPTGPQGPGIISSAPFVVSNWIYDSVSLCYYADFTLTDITQAIADSGVFEVYKEYTNGWTNLPDLNGKNYTVFNFRTGGYTIQVYSVDYTKPDAPGALKFRTVVIPK